MKKSLLMLVFAALAMIAISIAPAFAETGTVNSTEALLKHKAMWEMKCAKSRGHGCFVYCVDRDERNKIKISYCTGQRDAQAAQDRAVEGLTRMKGFCNTSPNIEQCSK